MKNGNTDSNEVRIGVASLLILVLGVIAVFSISSSDTFIFNKLDSEKYVPYEGADSNVNLGSYNLTASYANVSKQVAQYQRRSADSAVSINTWNNITFERREELTSGYSLGEGNDSVVVDFDGIVKLQGRIIFHNNATNNEEQKLSIRTVVNNNDTLATQSTKNMNRPADSYNTVVITGLIPVSKGDEIALQYLVDDLDLIIQSDDVFDEKVSVSFNLERVSK